VTTPVDAERGLPGGAADPPAPDPRPGLWSAPFVLCAISNLLQGIAFNLYLHVPGFLAELGASPVVIGWIFALTSAVAIAVRPGIGSVMDRRGRRVLILAGHALNIVVTALYLTVDRIDWWVYVVRMLHGISEATLFTVLFTYAADRVPRTRLTEGLALFGVSGMLPMSVGGALGDWILARADYSALFATAVGFSVVAALFALPLRDAPPDPDADAESARPRGFFATLRQADLVPIWWITTIFFLALSGIFIFLKTYVMTRGAGSVGGFFTAYTAVAIALRVGLGWLPDRVGPVRVLVPSILALAAGVLALALADSDATVAAAGALCGLGHGYTFPILSGLVVSRVGERDRGSALALYTGIADVGSVIGGPAFGLLVDHLGYGAMYGTVAVVLAAGLGLFVPWDAWVHRAALARAAERLR
jgi:MFS family permease